MTIIVRISAKQVAVARNIGERVYVSDSLTIDGRDSYPPCESTGVVGMPVYRNLEPNPAGRVVRAIAPGGMVAICEVEMVDDVGPDFVRNHNVAS